jgi:hypothetical protein
MATKVCPVISFCSTYFFIPATANAPAGSKTTRLNHNHEKRVRIHSMQDTTRKGVAIRTIGYLRVVVTELDGIADLISVHGNHIIHQSIAYSKGFLSYRLDGSSIRKETNGIQCNNSSFP